MSLFGNQFFASPASSSPSGSTSFHPLFRLLEDFETHNSTREAGEAGATASAHHHHNNNNSAYRQFRPIMRSFTPKFDVKELPEAYELHGDLPGIEQRDVEIEFTDIQTITVRGRTERSYTSGESPSGFIEGASTSSTTAQGAIEAGGNKAAHKATVEDEDAANNNTRVTTADNNNNKGADRHEPKAKYWVSERSVGEFSRSFTFPVRVDQDAVKASMKNGVLSITVPKAKKNGAKKIHIGAA